MARPVHVSSNIKALDVYMLVYMKGGGGYIPLPGSPPFGVQVV